MYHREGLSKARLVNLLLSLRHSVYKCQNFAISKILIVTVFDFSLISLVVNHNLASKECRRKMGEAYELNRRKNGLVTKDDLRNLRRKLEACDETPAVRNKKKQSTIKNFPK